MARRKEAQNDALCADCEIEAGGFEDPRDPPIQVGDAVLCRECAIFATGDRIEELESEVEDLQGTLVDLVKGREVRRRKR